VIHFIAGYLDLIHPFFPFQPPEAPVFHSFIPLHSITCRSRCHPLHPASRALTGAESCRCSRPVCRIPKVWREVPPPAVPPAEEEVLGFSETIWCCCWWCLWWCGDSRSSAMLFAHRATVAGVVAGAEACFRSRQMPHSSAEGRPCLLDLGLYHHQRQSSSDNHQEPDYCCCCTVDGLWAWPWCKWWWSAAADFGGGWGRWSSAACSPYSNLQSW
jgi:hypothetical protein